MGLLESLKQTEINLLQFLPEQIDPMGMKAFQLVPPEDPEVVENAIRRALNDDELVNRAAEVNYRLAANRLDQTILKPEAVAIYNTVAREKNLRHESN